MQGVRAPTTFGTKVFIALAIASSGCVLFIPATEAGDRCRFSGETTDCGECIAASCQNEVNACCGNQCGSMLNDIEACAARRDQACDVLTAPKASTSAAEALRTCVHNTCFPYCSKVTGKSQASCRPSAGWLGVACRCTGVDTDGANDFDCSEATHPGAMCCAAEGYPATGLGCTCEAFQCTSTNSGCLCYRRPYLSPDATTDCSGTHCCLSEGACSCRSYACSSWETPVDRCTAQVAMCDAGQHRVGACTSRL